MCTANAQTQAALCAKHGLRSCFPGWSSAGTVKLGGSVKGYYLRDEPHAANFKGLAETIDGIHRSQPDALVFVNLLGGYMPSPAAAMGWWGFPTYHQCEKLDGLVVDGCCLRPRPHPHPHPSLVVGVPHLPPV